MKKGREMWGGRRKKKREKEKKGKRGKRLKEDGE